MTPDEYLFYLLLTHIVTITGILAVAQYIQWSKYDNFE